MRCRRAKAAWEDHYAAQLPILRQEKPGLRLAQYRNMIFEEWQTNPLNPRNQPK